MNWLNLSFVLWLLIISSHTLVEAGESDEESLPPEQKVDTPIDPDLDTGKARYNDASQFMDQIFRQPSLTTFSYNPFKSVSHNIGYNLGRTVGRTPFSGTPPLDTQSDASKVVLVLANDTPETSALPKPDEETLKRLVRNPDFFQEFMAHLASINAELSQQVPAITRTVGEGVNEVFSQAPILGAAHQAGGIDYAKLGQTFGESILPHKMFAGVGDAFNISLPQNDTTPAPMTETERVENELSPDQQSQGRQLQGPSSPFNSMLMDNPLFRSFQQLVPPSLPTPSAGNNPFMFNPAQSWPWLQSSQAPQAAASSLSEIHVKPRVQRYLEPEGSASSISEMRVKPRLQRNQFPEGAASSFSEMHVNPWLQRNQFPEGAASSLSEIRVNPWIHQNQPTIKPWLQHNHDLHGASSDISEVRVRPDMPSPYKISPKEGVSHTMNEMKLRAAMRDALTKKTIPILWFHLPEKNEQLSSSANNAKKLEKLSATMDEDLKMQLQLEAFEKQLIVELQQLQEVVKLANAMKKAQLEAKGKKSEANQSTKPLTLSTTPLYKITLADIERTLKDEYVQKLLQMISNSQKKEQEMKNRDSQTKYSTDLTGNPNKRQTTTSSTTLNRDDLMKMMTYAYRMAASNGKEMSWLKENPTQNLDGSSKTSQEAEQRQRMEKQPGMSNEQQWLMDKQQQMSMEAKQERDMSNERHEHHHHHPHSPFGHPSSFSRPPTHFGPPAHFVHHHHIARTNEPNMQTQQMVSNNGDQQTATMSQDQQMRLNDGAQMSQAWFSNQGEQMSQGQQFRQGDTLTTMPQSQNMQQAAWFANQAEQMAQDQQLRQGSISMTRGGEAMTSMSRNQNTAQGAWLSTEADKMAQGQQLKQGSAFANGGEPQMTLSRTQNPPQGSWFSNESEKFSQEQKMRQGGTTTTATEQQQFQTNPGSIQTPMNTGTTGQREWFEPNTQPQSLQPPQPFQGSENQMHRFATGEPQTMMMQMNMAQHPTLANPNLNPNTQMRQQQQWDPMSESPQQQSLATGSTAGMQISQQRQMPSLQMGQSAANPSEQFEPQMQIGTPTNERQFSNNPSMDMNGQLQQQQQRQMSNMAEQPPSTSMSVANNAGQTGGQQPIDSTSLERQGGNLHEQKKPTTADERQVAHDPGQLPMAGEATPQMPENAGKARHKGFDELLDLLGHPSHDKKHKDIGKAPPTVINYYYNPGGSRYPPVYAPPPAPPKYGYGGGYSSYGGGGYAAPPPPPKPKQSPYYGGGGYGSNAYGSYGGYRTATGDAEIEEMLKEHQIMPKLMLLTRPDDNRIRTTSTTTSTSLEDNSTDNADLKNQTKRPRPKSRRRSKRSASEYASLEPIDETSLSELRKTYKNSLKEITLNPNETPEQALERYNAESIREALEKANKQPMEISTGDEISGAEQKGTADQYGAESGHNHLSGQQQNIQLNEMNNPYNQYVTHPSGPQMNSMNQPYNQQSTHPLPQQQHHPQQNIYQNKAMPQSPYLSVVNSYEPVTVMDDYSVNPNPYQISTDNGVYTALNPGKSITYAVPYVKPEIAYGTRPHPLTVKLATLANSIANSQRRDVVYNNINYGSQLKRQKSTASRVHYRNTIDKGIRNRISYTPIISRPKVTNDCDQSIDSIYETLKQRLSECCTECKDKLLKILQDALKHPDLGHKDSDSAKQSYDTKESQNSNKDEEEQFRQWIEEMTEKGYDKNHLTKELQRDYMADGRFQLTIPEDEHSGELLYGPNQSFKRDTTIAETDTQVMTTEPLNNEEEQEEQQEQVREPEEIPAEMPNNISDKIAKSENSPKAKSSKKNHTLEPAESTTHSVYALRGKYKPNKRNAISTTSYNKHYGKKFAHHKDLKKMGNEISKSETKENDNKKHRNIEEILDFLYELSKVSKERNLKLSVASTTSTTKASSTSTTVLPVSTTSSTSTSTLGSTNSIASTSTSTSSSKMKRRKLKSSTKFAKASTSKDFAKSDSGK